MRSTNAGWALVGVGALAIVVGVSALVFDWGVTESTTGAVAESSESTSSSTTSSSSSTTSSTLPPAETPEQFVELWAAAFRNGDAVFLFDRMAQPVLDRYGADQCETFAASLNVPDFELTIREIAEPGPFDYETDGRTETIADSIGIEVERLEGGQTIIQEVHVIEVDGELRWFTDCGNPV